MNVVQPLARRLLFCAFLACVSLVICCVSCEKRRKVTRIDYLSGGYYIGEVAESIHGGPSVRPDGHGVLFYSNGLVCVGEWKDGEQNGFGCEFNTNIIHNIFSYVGEYKRGLKRGRGMMMRDNVLYLGEWSFSLKKAQGIMIHSNVVSFGVSEIDYLRRTTDRMKTIWSTNKDRVSTNVEKNTEE